MQSDTRKKEKSELYSFSLVRILLQISPEIHEIWRIQNTQQFVPRVDMHKHSVSFRILFVPQFLPLLRVPVKTTECVKCVNVSIRSFSSPEELIISDISVSN